MEPQQPASQDSSLINPETPSPKENFTYKRWIIFIVVLVVATLIGLAIVFGKIKLPISNTSLSPSSSTAQHISTPSASENLKPTAQLVGEFKEFNGKQVLININNKESRFQVTTTTIFSKCTDFKNINSCTVSEGKNILKGAEVEIFAKGEEALFILHK